MLLWEILGVAEGTAGEGHGGVVEGEPLGRWAGTVMIWGVGTEVGRGQSLRCRRHVEELRFPFKSNEKPLRISNARMVQNDLCF